MQYGSCKETGGSMGVELFGHTRRELFFDSGDFLSVRAFFIFHCLFLFLFLVLVLLWVIVVRHAIFA
jgi:hypothetical protein